MVQHGKHRPLVIRLARYLSAALLAVCLGQAAAAQSHCRLALVLALDVSSSVDADEYILQRDGMAAALGDADIRRAILDGPGEVAIAIYEWSGRRQSALVSDWQMLRSDDDIDQVIARLLRAERSHTRFPTAMGYAMGYGATLFSTGPDCDRRVIDVSGDGQNNDGFPPRLAYKHFPFSNVVVNGLAVLGSDPDVLDYFQREVRFGAGAFVETSQGYAGYREAMTRKLFRELNDLILGSAPVTDAKPG